MINALSGPKQSNTTGNKNNALHHRKPKQYISPALVLHKNTTVPGRRRTPQERTDERGKRMVPRRKGMDCAVLGRTELDACTEEEEVDDYEVAQRPRKALECFGTVNT
jgi:hypothetical protein